MAISSNEAANGMRPTLVIAEALVDRQVPSQIADRARKLGFSPCLTSAVVTACCGRRTTNARQLPPTVLATSLESAQS